MFIRIFKNYSSFQIILLIFFSIAGWTIDLALGSQQIAFSYSNSMPLSNWLMEKMLLLKYPFILTLIILFINALLIVRLSIQFILLNERSYLQAFIYIIALTLLPVRSGFSPLIVCAFFMIISLERLLKSYKTNMFTMHIFESALFFSIASLFSIQILYSLPFLFISMFFLGKWTWRDIVSGILGLLVPYYIMIFIFYYQDQLPYFFELLYENLTLENPLLALTIPEKVFIIGFSLLLLLSLIKVLLKLSLLKVQTRNFLLSLIWFFVFTLLLVFIGKHWKLDALYLFMIPGSIFISELLLTMKKTWIANLIIILSLFSILIVKCWTLLEPLLQLLS